MKLHILLIFFTMCTVLNNQLIYATYENAEDSYSPMSTDIETGTFESKKEAQGKLIFT